MRFLKLFQKIVLSSLQYSRLGIFTTDLLDFRLYLRRFQQANFMQFAGEKRLVELAKTSLAFSDLVRSLLVLL